MQQVYSTEIITDADYTDDLAPLPNSSSSWISVAYDDCIKPIRDLLGLVWFYGRSTIFYISNIWFVNSFCRYTQLNDQTVLFQTIQFSISQQS